MHVPPYCPICCLSPNKNAVWPYSWFPSPLSLFLSLPLSLESHSNRFFFLFISNFVSKHLFP